MTLYEGEKYSSIMKMHSGLSALTLFWFQRSKKEDWNESYKLARKLKITSNTHIRMFIEILFDCSTPDPILSSSDVFYCCTHCFIDFSVSLTSYFFVFLSPSSYSHLYICRWLGVHFKEKISNNALMCVWVCLNLACILLLPHCSCTCSYACISMHSYQHATFGFFKSQTMKIQVQMDVVCCGIYEPIFNSWYAFNT